MATRFRPANADAGGEVLAHAIRYEELRVLGPTVRAFDEAHLVGAERLAMRSSGVLPVRRPVTDVTVEDDQRRPARGLTEGLQRTLDELDVVRIADAQHVPLVALESRRDVLGKSELGAAFDRDVIVVVDPA